MEKNILIGVIIFVVICVLFILFKIKSSNFKSTIPEKKLEDRGNISNMQSPKKRVTSNITSKKSGILDQTPNPILKEKAANWTESESYDEDIKNLDIDNLLSENIKENDIKIENKIDIDTKENNFKTLVLLVDDSLVVRKYVGDLLKKHEYDIVLKNDGWEAISYLTSTTQKPEIIISDIEMPNMDGFQLINAIRKEKRYNNVPILVISAHAESHLRLMEEENIQGFIKKPFEDTDLIQQIKYLLES